MISLPHIIHEIEIDFSFSCQCGSRGGIAPYFTKTQLSVYYVHSPCKCVLIMRKIILASENQ